MLEKAYVNAVDILMKCATHHGFYASAGKKGYNAVWSRDSMISSIGASLVEDKEIKEKFRETFRASLITLGNNQSKLGQIPNCVDKWSNRESHVDYKSIDSTLWFLIGHHMYRKRYDDNHLFIHYRKEIQKALNWLKYQDISETGLLAQHPTTDWQDAFPHKYGHTINTQALYHKTLIFYWQYEKAGRLRHLVNNNKEDGLWGKEFYYAWRWKNHGQYKEIGEWFDTLGNCLAIVFDLASIEKAEKIINYIEKNKINQPYPIKAIYPPIKKGDKEWHDYYLDCDAGDTNSYLNGGIWTYIGCFYVLALIKLKKFKEAEVELKKIAEANVKYNFPEWIHSKTKKSFGKEQTWNAGMYVLAYESLKKKKVLI
jgi:hypothetical protein